MKSKFVKAFVWFLSIALLMNFMPSFNVHAFAETKGNVYYVSTDGNDANTGKIDNPFKTVNFACTKLNSGDTLILRKGTYNAYIVIIGKNDITLKAYEGEKVIVKNDLAETGYVAYVGDSNNVDISGIAFTFNDTSKSGSAVIVHHSSSLKFHDCEMYGAQCGIMMRANSDDDQVYNNNIHDCTWAYGGIMLYQATNANIYNNIIYNSYFGINSEDSNTTKNKVYNNTFYNNTLDLGATDYNGVAQGNIFRNNIFSSVFENTKDFVKKNDFNYNCYNKNKLSTAVTNDNITFDQFKSNGQEKDGILDDPAFQKESENNFALKDTSCCIGKGDSGYVPKTDYAGVQRSVPVDIGAYANVSQKIYYVSINGNDNNNGDSETPFRTIQHAVDIVKDGSLINIEAGTYDETVDIKNKNNLTVQNFKQDNVVINKLVTIESCSNIVFQCATLKGSILATKSKNVKMSKLDVINSHVCVVPDTDGYEISSCYIHGYNGEGAILIYNGKNGSIFNNVIYSNNHQAMLLEGSDTVNNKIYNNTCYGNDADLVLVSAASIGDPSNNVFKNNIFSNGLQIGSNNFIKNTVFDYNCYNKYNMKDTIGYVEGVYITLDQLKAYGQEKNGFLGDPAFANSANNDFRLSKYSDCKEKGIKDEFSPAKDITGVTRDEPYDIGAYKYSGVINNYYVSPDGNDSNAGTEQSPFKTLQHAVDLTRPGETIFLKGGTYNESISIKGKQGSDYINIKPEKGDKVVFDSGNSKDYAFDIDSSSYIRLESISIKNYKNSGIVIQNGSSNLLINSIDIEGCMKNEMEIDNSAYCEMNSCKLISSGISVNGLMLNGSSQIKSENCQFSGMLDTSVEMNKGGSNKILGSIFMNNKKAIVLSESSNNIIYNNSTYKTSDVEINMNKSTGNRIKNNSFGSPGKFVPLVINSADLKDNDIDYNCYNRQNDSALFSLNNGETSNNYDLSQLQARSIELNGIAGDPLYNDPDNGDLSLKAGSPCSGKGITDGNQPSVGYDGTAFTSPMDIGAYFCIYSNKVYFVATDGDDSNDGSIAHPWKTVQKAMEAIRPSDTLYLRGGVYDMRSDCHHKKGTDKAWFTIKNYNNEKVIIDSNHTRDTAFKFIDCSYYKIEGLTIRNYNGAGVWVTEGSNHILVQNMEIYNIANGDFSDNSGTEGILGDGSYSTVRNCYIHDIGQIKHALTDHGIYIGYGVDHWTFDSNRIDNISGAGIHFYGAPVGGDNCTVINNIISRSRWGLVLTRGNQNLISNNTFYNDWDSDLYFDWNYTNSTVQNNIFYNDLPKGMKVQVKDGDKISEQTINPVIIGIYCGDVKDNIIKNNIYFNKNFGGRIRLNSDSDLGPVYTLKEYLDMQNNQNTFVDLKNCDPLMNIPADITKLSDNDFTLLKGSPCIDTGLTENSPSYDYYGNMRDSKPDIGAVEYRLPAYLKNISINIDSTTLYVGNMQKINITGKMSDGTDADLKNIDIKYVSSNTDVLDIINGVIKTKAAGTADIYAAVTVNGNKITSNKITITVKSVDTNPQKNQTGGNTNTNGKGNLPKTGFIFDTTAVMFAGILILIAGLVLFYKKRKTSK